jgi:protein SCO1/2
MAGGTMNTRLIGWFLLLAGCSHAASVTPPLADARIGGPFTLVNQDGRTVTDRDFTGRYRIMYFGYTFCPDVCPADMGKISAGLKLLEAQDPALGRRVVPVFATVDPERDTPAVLKQFVSAFHPRLVGLTGSPAAIDRVAREFAVFHQKDRTTPGGGYLVQHSAVTYLFDPAGKPLAILPTDGTPQALADEIRKWAT